MEKKIRIKIYASYGELAHEFEPVYSDSYKGEINEEIQVVLPHVVGENPAGEPVLKLGEHEYLLSEVLGNVEQEPALVWYDGHKTHREKLKIVEE